VTTIDAHGLVAELPAGWDGEIYVRPAAVPTPGVAAPASAYGTSRPVMQMADFALPAERGDFGGGAVELMGSQNLFVSLFEHGSGSAATPLFATAGPPWPVAADAFGPNRLQRQLAGQAGAQWFFSVDARAFCLYAVLGSYLLRGVLTARLNTVLATIQIT
jgi:hypothetical protein